MGGKAHKVPAAEVADATGNPDAAHHDRAYALGKIIGGDAQVVRHALVQSANLPPTLTTSKCRERPLGRTALAIGGVPRGAELAWSVIIGPRGSLCRIAVDLSQDAEVIEIGNLASIYKIDDAASTKA